MPPTTPPADLQRQLEQLDDLAASGALTADQVRDAKARLGAVPRPSRRLVAGLVVFCAVFAAAGYAWLGTPQGWNVSPGSPAVAEAGPTHVSDAEVEAMLKRLTDRLAQQPEDAEGWSMLGRSYMVLGRFADAVGAFRKLLALRPDDAQALVDLADAQAMQAGRKLAGEPEKLIQRALELDPRNLKALALAGTIAFDRGDFAAAVRHWEAAIAAAQPGSELAQNLQSGVDEARRRGGMPASPTALAAAPAASAAPPAAAPPPVAPATPAAPATAAAGAQVSGKVVLAGALQGRAGPDDTLFVFARPADGSRMPLALLKKRVADLPLEFSLDDTMAMSPAARLSGAQQVVVGARISKSGNAMPQPGDLQGFSPPVPVGTGNVSVEIADVVK
jgi:cytochrome c-type biogenesis protein CcmH